MMLESDLASETANLTKQMMLQNINSVFNMETLSLIAQIQIYFK